MTAAGNVACELALAIRLFLDGAVLSTASRVTVFSDHLSIEPVTKVCGLDVGGQHDVVIEVDEFLRQPWDPVQLQLDGVAVERWQHRLVEENLVVCDYPNP